ncbi:LPS assembly lipoprotein LptE [Candidatus Erwinia haradaeae]|uniref:LPS-assembly lipoprotein LptE n=1 Tax=Candidatus Erwinia haradaeae TaxID=1922217 RepID=A0A451DLY0_9GAMM|nr:LPS assembly lipoprotein LptE [Candidatus Erwinia haradaeae]VFP87734.1 LPS-assembly lipoprotein LptE [Candidatus Erwinia haradaeae]
MKKLLVALFLGIFIWGTNGCGYHRYHAIEIPFGMKTLVLDTEDPYGPLAMTLHEALQLHNIHVIKRKRKNIKISSIRLQKEEISRNALSIFSDGKTSEYSITMTIFIQMIIPHKGIYPITSTVSRSFFDHPYAPLAKDTEQSIIISDMRMQAVENLIHQFLKTYYTANHTTIKLHDS